MVFMVCGNHENHEQVLSEKKISWFCWFPPTTPLRDAGQSRADPRVVRKDKQRYSPTAALFTLSQREDREEMLKSSVIGNLGSEPELKYSANGAPFLRFNVASNGRVRDEAGNWSDVTTWVRVTMFGQRAETLSQHLHKGTRVFVDGRLEAKPWTGQNGQLNAGLEIIASDVEFFSTKPETAARVTDSDNSDVPF
jgi:single-strand DNA-binding protein